MKVFWLVLAMMIGGVFAEPVPVGTKSEVQNAKGLIDKLVASGADAEKLVSMAAETEKGPERFWLYSNAFVLQAKEGDYAEATETLRALQQNVTDIPEVNIVNLIERNVGKKIAEAPELAAILKESKTRLAAQRLAAKLKQDIRKNPKAAALKASFGEALAVNGDWDEALKTFIEAEGKVSEIADAELQGKRTMGIAEFWWDYRPCRELASSAAFRAHAAEIYTALIRDDKLSVVEKALAENRAALFSGVDADVRSGNVVGESQTAQDGTQEVLESIFMSLKKIPEREFFMSSTELTQKQWEFVMGYNPSEFKGPQKPVESVSYDDCLAFVKRINEMPKVVERGYVFRLPHDDEWLYVANAGHGNEESTWFKHNSGGALHDVATKSPNAFGIYDMWGNVWEWTDRLPNGKVARRGASYDSIPKFFRKCLPESSGHRSKLTGMRLVAERKNGATEIASAGTGSKAEQGSAVGGNNAQCRDDGRPQRPNGLNDVDRKNLPKLWSAPGVREHVLKRSDGGNDLVFVECPPGDFVMGFREENGWAFSRHRVTLTYPFWMLKTQLTWGQFYMPGVSERGKGDRHGCNSFSCEQMAAYLHCLNDKYASQIPKGYVIRFPTFAEYQYAYRANSKDPSDPYTHDAFVGDERKRICHDNNTRKGWNGNRRTWPRVWPAEVGLLEPNAWGLYDMCGNGFTYLCDRVNPDLTHRTHFYFAEHETDPVIYEDDAGRMLMRGGDNPDWLYMDFFCTWRWAFTCRLVVGPDLEKKGRELMERTSLARHDATFAAMADGLAKRKHGPATLLGRRTVTLFPGCVMEFVQCPPGSFTMGHEVSNGPFRRREVTISRPFYIATERMTFGAWFKFLKATGRVVPEEQRAVARKRGGERCALCGLKDEDWNGFLMWLNDRSASDFKGAVFRLPTEAEWEYAYRAGASRQDDPFAWTVPFWGRQADAAAPFAYTEDERRQDFLRFGRGSVTETSWDAYTADWRRKMLVSPGQVGMKKANAWGLKDMIGNGREWVLDRFCCAAGKFPNETYGQLPQETDPFFGAELDKWDCQMCRGGDDGYAGRKCWDANGSDWGEDAWYPKELFCYRLVIGPDLVREKRGGDTP